EGQAARVQGDGDRAARGVARREPAGVARTCRRRANRAFVAPRPAACVASRAMAALIRWTEWCDEAFAQARERKIPVLLFVRAAWCRFSSELERTVFTDPRVQELVTKKFVAIQVDKDRRPDIDARYSKGGWPTLAWLDDTGELLA